MLGHMAGDQLVPATLGFLLTGVGLPLVGVIACAKVGGGLEKLTNLFPKKVALAFFRYFVLRLLARCSLHLVRQWFPMSLACCRLSVNFLPLRWLRFQWFSLPLCCIWRCFLAGCWMRLVNTLHLC